MSGQARPGHRYGYGQVRSDDRVRSCQVRWPYAPKKSINPLQARRPDRRQLPRLCSHQRSGKSKNIHGLTVSTTSTESTIIQKKRGTTNHGERGRGPWRGHEKGSSLVRQVPGSRSICLRAKRPNLGIRRHVRPFPRPHQPPSPGILTSFRLVLFRRTKMFHVIYEDPPGKEGEDITLFDQHEPWTTAKNGIVSYRSTFSALFRDRCR